MSNLEDKIKGERNNVHFEPIPQYEHKYEPQPDFHAVDTISLGELIDCGFVDWEDDSWKWDAFDDVQYARVCKKFNNRFFWREISTLPPKRWKMELLSKFNRIMPKYRILYAIINDDDLYRKDLIMQKGSKYGKSRDIKSSFPQMQLSGNSDYASSGTDNEYEHIEDGDFIEKYLQFMKDYNDIDELLLNEFETFFSPFLAVSINGM